MGRCALLTVLLLASACSTDHTTDDAGSIDAAPPDAVVADALPPDAGTGPAWVDVVAGEHFTCGLRADASVWCWGRGAEGELGDAARGATSVPRAVAGLSDIVSLSAGRTHACAVNRTGQVLCWGRNVEGEAGGDAPVVWTPTPVGTIGDAVEVRASDWHTCVLRRGGTVSCWGLNWGELGPAAPPHTGSGPPHTGTPVDVPGISGATGVLAISGSSCARLDTGTLCWGAVASGPVPSAVPGFDDIIDADSGWSSQCVVHAGGTVGCSGNNEFGALGGSSAPPTSTDLVPIGGLHDAVRVSMSGGQACALSRSGASTCWGRNVDGRLGRGTRADVDDPAGVVGLSATRAVAVGGYLDEGHACAIDDAAGLVCWGHRGEGATGDGTPPWLGTPSVVSGLANVASVAASARHTCATSTDGTLSCWGENRFMQLGTGDASDRGAPAVIGSGMAQVATGKQFSCAVGTSGVVSCWGDPADGETASAIPRATPYLTRFTGVASLSSGYLHSCATRHDGTAVCWGSDFSGESAGTMASIAGISDAVSVRAARWHSCLLHATGAVDCFGSNSSGEIGDPAAVGARNPPTPVPGLTGVTAIAAGGAEDESGDDDTSCAVTADGRVHCWGTNTHGGLGDGTTTDSRTPVDVAGVSGATSVATWNGHTCAVTTDGSAWCWGDNSFGQLGDGTTTDRPTPVRVGGTEHFVDIATGGWHTCARRDDGTLLCWGSDSNGQLGQGRELFALAPAPVVTAARP